MWTPFTTVEDPADTHRKEPVMAFAMCRGVALRTAGFVGVLSVRNG
jgi:hypothetical protein